MSGTGPKAGGPLYLHRLVATDVERGRPPALTVRAAPLAHESVTAAYRDFLVARGFAAAAARVEHYMARSNVGTVQELPGPVGERNVYVLKPRGRIVAIADSALGTLLQLGAILATGNRAVLEAANPAAKILAGLPREISARIETVPDWQAAGDIAALLFAGDQARLRQLNQQAARRDGPILSVHGTGSAGLADGSEDYALELLLAEVSISTNTAAAGGNAKLMTIG